MVSLRGIFLHISNLLIIKSSRFSENFAIMTLVLLLSYSFRLTDAGPTPLSSRAAANLELQRRQLSNTQQAVGGSRALSIYDTVRAIESPHSVNSASHLPSSSSPRGPRHQLSRRSLSNAGQGLILTLILFLALIIFCLFVSRRLRRLPDLGATPRTPQRSANSRSRVQFSQLGDGLARLGLRFRQLVYRPRPSRQWPRPLRQEVHPSRVQDLRSRERPGPLRSPWYRWRTRTGAEIELARRQGISLQNPASAVDLLEQNLVQRQSRVGREIGRTLSSPYQYPGHSQAWEYQHLASKVGCEDKYRAVSSGLEPLEPCSTKSRECDVCLELRTGREFPWTAITSSCQHERNICLNCIASGIRENFDSNAWTEARCMASTCEGVFTYDGIGMYAFKKDFAMSVSPCLPT